MTSPLGGGLPTSARLAWWGTAWLRGRVVADQVLDAVLGGDVRHTVSGLERLTAAGRSGAGRLPDAPAGVTTGLVEGLATLRAAGADALAAVYPAAGDPAGLAGPARFNVESLAAGEAVLAVGAQIGLVPERTGPVVVWHAHPANRRRPPDLGEADRALRGALVSAATALGRLDVPGWRPEVADRLRRPGPRAARQAGSGPPAGSRERVAPAPPGVPPRCVSLADRALRMLDVVTLALAENGGALTGREAAERRHALVALERAARHALAAACSPDGWPP